LQKEAALQEVVQLVGSDSLPEKERLTLEVAKMIREGILQQNAFHEVDAYCSPNKQYLMLKGVMRFGDLALEALENGATLDTILANEKRHELTKLGFIPEEEIEAKLETIFSSFRFNSGTAEVK